MLSYLCHHFLVVLMVYGCKFAVVAASADRNIPVVQKTKYSLYDDDDDDEDSEKGLAGRYIKPFTIHLVASK